MNFHGTQMNRNPSFRFVGQAASLAGGTTCTARWRWAPRGRRSRPPAVGTTIPACRRGGARGRGAQRHACVGGISRRAPSPGGGPRGGGGDPKPNGMRTDRRATGAATDGFLAPPAPAPPRAPRGGGGGGAPAPTGRCRRPRARARCGVEPRPRRGARRRRAHVIRCAARGRAWCH